MPRAPKERRPRQRGDSDADGSDKDIQEALRLSQQTQDEDEEMQTALLLSLDQESSDAELLRAIDESVEEAFARQEQEDLAVAVRLSLQQSVVCDPSEAPAVVQSTFTVETGCVRHVAARILSCPQLLLGSVAHRIDSLVDEFWQELASAHKGEEAGEEGDSSVPGDTTADSADLQDITPLTADQPLPLPPTGDVEEPDFIVGDCVLAATGDDPSDVFQPALVVRVGDRADPSNALCCRE